MQDWMRELTPEELPEPHRTLAATIGMEAAIQLMDFYGGTYYYVPKVDVLLRQVRDKTIRQEYNGYNLKSLALKYKLSQKQIGNILREQGIEDGQISLFDEPDE